MRWGSSVQLQYWCVRGQDIRESMTILTCNFTKINYKMLQEVFQLLLTPQSPDAATDTEEHGGTNQASLTQQILQYCASHWAASHTASLKGKLDRPDRVEGDREGEKLEVKWWRRDEQAEKIEGWMQGRLGVERAGWPCIRCINYWSAWGKKNMRTETPVGEGGEGENLLKYLGNSLNYYICEFSCV